MVALAKVATNLVEQDQSKGEQSTSSLQQERILEQARLAPNEATPLNGDSDVLSALESTSEVTITKSVEREITPFSRQERTELLDKMEEYGKARAQLALELEHYRKHPPQTEKAHQRMEQLQAGVAELDQQAVENFQEVKEQLALDPELNIQMQLEFTQEMRSLREQQSLNQLRTELTASMVEDCKDTISWAKSELEDVDWLESLSGGEKPWKIMIEHEEGRKLPQLEKQLELFEQMRTDTETLIAQFKDNQTQAILAEIQGADATQFQQSALSALVAVNQIDTAQEQVIDIVIQLNKDAGKANSAAWDSYTTNLQTAAETATMIRNTGVVVATGIATAGTGLLVGGAIGLGVAVTTRVGGNTLAALTDENIDIEDVFKDFDEQMAGDLVLVVSGVVSAGVGGAVTRGVLGRSTTLLSRVGASMAGGATAAGANESIMIAKELGEALIEFERSKEGQDLTDEERSEHLSKFLEGRGLSTEGVLRRLGTSVAAGAVGGAFGAVGSQMSSQATARTAKVAIEVTEMAADVVAGEGIAMAIHGEDISMKAIMHGIMAAGMGSIASRASTPRTDPHNTRGVDGSVHRIVDSDVDVHSRPMVDPQTSASVVRTVADEFHGQWQDTHFKQRGEGTARWKGTSDAEWIERNRQHIDDPNAHWIRSVDKGGKQYVEVDIAALPNRNLPLDRQAENVASAEVAVRELLSVAEQKKKSITTTDGLKTRPLGAELSGDDVLKAADTVHREWKERNPWIYDKEHDTGTSEFSQQVRIMRKEFSEMLSQARHDPVAAAEVRKDIDAVLTAARVLEREAKLGINVKELTASATRDLVKETSIRNASEIPKSFGEIQVAKKSQVMEMREVAGATEEFNLSWGKLTANKGTDVVLYTADDPTGYPIKREIFEATYQETKPGSGVYEKRQLNQLVQIPEGHIVTLKTLEGTETARAGDWIAIGKEGEVYAQTSEWVKANLRMLSNAEKAYEPLPPSLKNWVDSMGERNYGKELNIQIASDAALVAQTLKSPAAIREWAELPYEQQKQLVPEISDGHSGASFSQVVALAIRTNAA